MPALGKYKSKHKRKDNPLYSVWYTMHLRCYSKRRKDYKYYGGRGIVVCPSWHSFDNFVDDMQADYSKGLSLERVDVNAAYSKDNCIWTTHKKQCNNRRTNNYITNPETGEQKTLTEWAEFFNVKERTVSSRYNILGLRDFKLLFYKGKLPRNTKYDYDQNEAVRVVD